MEKEKIKAYVDNLNKYEMIKIQDSKEERLIFKDSEKMFKIFGGEDKVLEPFNDFSYKCLSNFFDFVSETIYYNDFETLEELEEKINDSMHENIDSQIDIYNHDLLKWVSQSLDKAYYVNDAINECGINGEFDLFKALQMGQGKEIEELYNLSLNILMELLKEEFEED